MPPVLAMYDRSLTHIGPRLDALGLQLQVVTFWRDGLCALDGRTLPPEEVSADYVWLAAPITADDVQEQAFGLVERMRRVGVLQTYNAGLDHPFYRRMSQRGTRICNSSAQAVAISEYVFGQLMSVLQPIAEQRALQVQREWKITPYREIAGTTWLIVGYGPIGREVAKRAKAFGARTLAVRRKAEPSPDVDRMGTLADLPSMLPEADVIVLAAPLNAATKGMADARFFATAKAGATLVNVARGGLVDDAAMIAALDGGRLAHAILDVFHEEPLPVIDPLWAHPKVRMTSHTSFAGSGVRGRWDALFLDNIQRFVKGEQLVNVVRPEDLA